MKAHHLSIEMVYPEPCKRIKKAAAAISGWDCPLLTFIYPGFDCGSFWIEQLAKREAQGHRKWWGK